MASSDNGKGGRPTLGPRPQTDLEAANSATPDTDRPPFWDDPEAEAYALATDPVSYYAQTGDWEAAEDAAWEKRQQAIEVGDWTEDDEENFIDEWGDEDDEEGE